MSEGHIEDFARLSGKEGIWTYRIKRRSRIKIGKRGPAFDYDQDQEGHAAVWPLRRTCTGILRNGGLKHWGIGSADQWGACWGGWF
jgi:hypothetical protein